MTPKTTAEATRLLFEYLERRILEEQARAEKAEAELAAPIPIAHAICSEHATLRDERDEARYTARALAHAYQHDSRPPDDVVDRAITYPVEAEKKARER